MWSRNLCFAVAFCHVNLCVLAFDMSSFEVPLATEETTRDGVLLLQLQATMQPFSLKRSLQEISLDPEQLTSENKNDELLTPNSTNIVNDSLQSTDQAAADSEAKGEVPLGNVMHFGPQHCVSTFKINDTCIMKTQCAGIDVGTYEFGFICADAGGAKMRHLFGKNSFALVETFDTLIPCDKCLALENEPSRSVEMSMADLYQHADYSRQEEEPPRTMADFYQRSSKSWPSVPWSRTSDGMPPSALRRNAWVACLAFTLASFVIFLQAIGQRKQEASLPFSRLPGASVDISTELIPSGTVCAVCLSGCEEDGDSRCDAYKGESAEVEMRDSENLSTSTGDRWCRTPCDHCFHRACLERWLSAAAVSRGKIQQRCPVCNWS